MNGSFIWLYSVGAFLTSFILTHLLCYTPFLDHPNERSAHINPIPRVGGAAIAGSVGLFYGLSHPFLSSSYVFMGLCALFIVSFLDDIRPQGVCYRTRLIIHLLTSAFFIVGVGYIQLPVELSTILLSPLSIFFTFICFIFFINASNFTDGLNGLLSGCVMTGCVFWAYMNYDNPTFALALLLGCSTLGFFIHNFHFGRIFLGDAGSTFLGAMAGLIPLYASHYHEHAFTSWFIHISILSPVWVDVAFTLLYKLSKKEIITQPHRDFPSQLLNRAGLTHTHVTLLYIMSICICGGLAILNLNHTLDVFEWFVIIVWFHIIRVALIYLISFKKGVFD